MYNGGRGAVQSPFPNIVGIIAFPVLKIYICPAKGWGLLRVLSMNSNIIYCKSHGTSKILLNETTLGGTKCKAMKLHNQKVFRINISVEIPEYLTEKSTEEKIKFMKI